VDIYFYYTSPTQGYWADLLSCKAEAKKRLDEPNEDVYWDRGHELLTTWGRQGQIFQDLLLNHDALQAVEYDIYDDNFSDTLLGGVQQDIFFTQTTDDLERQPDDSIAIHHCHSPLRECQVLHDSLLHAFTQDAALRPEDVLVMVPDISRYAPYIKAVFSRDADMSQASHPTIPFNLSDGSMADEHPIVATFFQLLSLPHSRFTRSDVESMLDVDDIRQQFALSDDDVETIHVLLEKLNVRWGVDGAHRASLDLPNNAEHTWQQAKQRCLTAYAMAGDAPLWQGIASIDISVGEAAMMSKFWSLVSCLDAWRKNLCHARSAQQWQEDIYAMLQDFLGDADDDEKQQGIRDVLATWAEYMHDVDVSLPLLTAYLHQKLSETDIPNRYFSGGVNFCGLRPMRTVPFKIVCLLGMNDAAFPRREHPIEFDKMTKHWKPGDPIKAEQDRYVMLETLLCCRQKFYISYVANSIRDNSACQASMLVSEFVDELQRKYGENMTQSLIHQHPMQAFSKLNYTAEQASHDIYWCQLANQLHQTSMMQQESNRPWPNNPIIQTMPSVESLALERLIQFVKQPVKFFVNHQLAIYLHDDEEQNNDEPFDLVHLEKWHIKQRCLQQTLKGEEPESERFKAEGLLPHGMAGKMAWKHEAEALAPLLAALEDYQGKEKQMQWVEVAIPMGGDCSVMLAGQVRDYMPTLGLLHATPSKLKGKYLLACWLEHLALCSAGILQQKECSRLQCSDQGCSFAWMDVAAAKAYLCDYIHAYVQGQQYPLPVFEGASYARVFEEKSTLKEVLTQWNGNSFQHIPGDKDDAYVQLIMRHVDENPTQSEAFSSWAHIFYDPINNAFKDAGEPS